MRPLILSGGPAVGKSMYGRRLAQERDKGAFIDADDIRQLIVAGDATLWSAAEGERQHQLAARNVSALAGNLIDSGFDVAIADVVTEAALPVYRANLPESFVVHLTITYEEARRRAATRKVYLTDDEFALLHDLMATPPEVDLVLDVTSMTIDEQACEIRSAWNAASRPIASDDIHR